MAMKDHVHGSLRQLDGTAAMSQRGAIAPLPVAPHTNPFLASRSPIYRLFHSAEHVATTQCERIRKAQRWSHRKRMALVATELDASKCDCFRKSVPSGERADAHPN